MTGREERNRHFYTRKHLVSTIYKPVHTNVQWFAEEYDKHAFYVRDISDVDVSLDVLKKVLRQSILTAKRIEDVKIDSMRSFLKKVEKENAKINALIDHWSPKELVYYCYRYNNSSLADFNKVLSEDKGLNIKTDRSQGFTVDVLVDNKVISTVDFSEKDYDFFMNRINKGETTRAKGILFEAYKKGLVIPPIKEQTQEGLLTKTILEESIGSDMGVVDFLYTGVEELVQNGIKIYTGYREFLPVDIKFSSRKDMMISIFKGIRAGKMLLKFGGAFPEEFKGMDKFKRTFIQWLREETSKQLLEEARQGEPGVGAVLLKQELSDSLKDKNSPVVKALSISMVLYKIVNNIAELLKGKTYSNEFPVFVQNPGLYSPGSGGSATGSRVISDILFSSEVLDSLYANLFDGEHVLSDISGYAFKKGIGVTVSPRKIRADSFKKIIVQSDAQTPVQSDQYDEAKNRHKLAIEGVLDRLIFELNYGKMGG